MLGFIQAFWGIHAFFAHEKHIRSITDGLNLLSELDVFQGETTEAQNPLDVRGGDRPKNFEIMTRSALAAGTLDPLTEYNQLVRDLGKSMPFIVGYMPWGGWRVILEHVEMENGIWGPKGNIIAADLILYFTEDKPAIPKAKDVKDISGPEKKAKMKELGLNFSQKDIEEGKKILGMK